MLKPAGILKKCSSTKDQEIVRYVYHNEANEPATVSTESLLQSGSSTILPKQPTTTTTDSTSCARSSGGGNSPLQSKLIHLISSAPIPLISSGPSTECQYAPVASCTSEEIDSCSTHENRTRFEVKTQKADFVTIHLINESADHTTNRFLNKRLGVGDTVNNDRTEQCLDLGCTENYSDTVNIKPGIINKPPIRKLIDQHCYSKKNVSILTTEETEAIEYIRSLPHNSIVHQLNLEHRYNQ